MTRVRRVARWTPNDAPVMPARFFIVNRTTVQFVTLAGHATIIHNRRQ